MILIPTKPVTEAEIKQMLEIYPHYIKIVVDIEKEILAAGGEYHADCEKELEKVGSIQKNLYGGGVSLESKKIDYMAMSNYKPQRGMITYEVADLKIRNTMKKIIQNYFGKFYE